MSGGAFRDGSAAIERAALLAEENERLKDELASLRKMVEGREDARELRKVLGERDELRTRFEEKEAAHVAAVSRLRAEANKQQRALHERVTYFESKVYA